MSGPKTSRYTLTPEQRRILAQQRELERRKAVASEFIRRNSKKLLHMGDTFGAEKQVSDELVKRTGNDNGIGNLLVQMEALVTPIRPAVDNTNFDDVTSVEQTAKKVASCLAAAEKLADKIVTISARNEAELKTNLQSAIDGGFATSFADIKGVDDSSESMREDAILKLRHLEKKVDLPSEYGPEIKEAIAQLENIDDKEFLKNMIALTVNPLIKRVNNYIDEYEAYHEEFDELYAEYNALCDLYYYVAQEYSCSAASVQALRAEIERMKNDTAENDEQAYISECLDEVMTEMGYSVLGSREVTKRNGKHFRNELYSYDEGTAVNITYSSDGKIAMELGGVDTSDRVPSAQETEKLCDSMEHFCGDFKEIENRLISKGIVLADRISLLPPNPEYAQIINTADYSMQTDVEAIQVKKQHKSVSKPQAMRRE